MSAPRALLADDSPHAQRMGERLLREEGWQVIAVSDGDTALLRLNDAMPALVIADVSMPTLTGYELCQHIKSSAGPIAPRVVLTAGAGEDFDEALLKECGADSTLRKPFEASLLLEQATLAKRNIPQSELFPTARPGRGVVVLDPEQVRAAVVLALDQVMPALTDRITEKVLISLNLKPYAR